MVEFQDGELYKEYHILWNFRKDGKPVLCPRANNGSRSAIQDFSQVLWDSGEQEFQDVAKKMWPKISCVFVGLEREKEEIDGLKLWAQTDAQFKQTMSAVLDDENIEDGGCIHDGQEKALDLVIEGSQGPKYKKVDIKASRKPTTLIPAKSKLTLDALRENEPNPDNLYASVTYEETEQLLQDFLEREGVNLDDLGQSEQQSSLQNDDAKSERELLDDKFNKLKSKVDVPDDDDIPY